MIFRPLVVIALAISSCGAQEPPPPLAIPVVIGGPQSGRQVAYIWGPEGKVVVATGPQLWNEVGGQGYAYIPAGENVTRIEIFMATDRGSCYEGNVQVLDQYGSAWAKRAEHKEHPFENYEAIRYYPTDFITDGSPLLIRWLCRVGCARYDPDTDQRFVKPDGTLDYSARCHFGIELELS